MALLQQSQVAGDIEFVAFPGDALDADAPAVAVLLVPELGSIDDLGGVLGCKLVLAYAFHEVLGGVDEEHVVRLFVLLEHEDAPKCR